MSFTNSLNATGLNSNSIPEPFLDPISFKLMSRPVTWGEHTFDLGSLQTWVQTCKSKGWPVTQPITRAALPANVGRVEDLPQNLAIRDMIEQFKLSQAAAPAAAMEIDASNVARQTSAQIFEQYKDTFIPLYWTPGMLTSFLGKWNSYSGGSALPAFGIGEKGAQEWFAYFTRNPEQRVKMLRLIVRFEDFRPLTISAQRIEQLASQTESELGNIKQKPAAAPAAAMEIDGSNVVRQPSAQMFEQYKDSFIPLYWTPGKLSSFLGKWNSYSGGSALPDFGVGEMGAKEWFAYFTRNPEQRVKMLCLIVRFEDLRPLTISEQSIEQLARQTESELGIVPPPVAMIQPKHSVQVVNPPAPLGAQPSNSLGSVFAYPPYLQPQQAKKPAAAPAAPPAALLSSVLVPVSANLVTVTDSERERRLLRMTESWLSHFGNFERLKLLISTWNSNISPALPSFGSDHHAASTAQDYFKGRRTTLGALFAILAYNPDLRPETLSAEEAIHFADPATLKKLSSPSHHESSAGTTKPSVATIIVPASSIVNDALREQTMHRMNESWSAHFGDINKLVLLCAAWNENITEKPHVPHFGDTHRAANEALNYFIGKRTTLAYLFALLAQFEDLRPEGLRKEDAARLANPDTLSRIATRNAMTD